MVKTLWLSEVLEKQKASSSFTSIAIIMTKTPLTHSPEEEDRMEWTICEKMIGKKFLASFQETDMFSKMTIFSLRWLPTVFWLMGKVGWVDWHPACLGHRFPPNQVALCCMYLVNPSSLYTDFDRQIVIIMIFLFFFLKRFRYFKSTLCFKWKIFQIFYKYVTF